MRYFIFILSLFFYANAIAQNLQTLRIGILVDYKLKTIIFNPEYCNYYVWADNKKIYEVEQLNTLIINAREDYVEIKTKNAQLLGRYKKVRLVGKQIPDGFSLRSFLAKVPERIYDNHLEINANDGLLKFVNLVNIQNYVAGVVEAENGIYENLEFYKAKAVICRTYALANIKKHQNENYHLCDRTHCQVYKGKSLLKDEIVMAISMTNGVVIVDENMNLITAAFHSNCGGQTINSEAVWSLGLDYLKSVKDTFCYKMPHAVWSKKIDKGRWLQFLKKYNKEIVYDSLHLYCYYSYEMYQREANFVIHQTDIPNKDIRSNFGLRSAYFDILELNQDSVLFKGRGFGHGVGLCQEGAMQMAKYGYNYVKILQHYYTGIHLVDISALEFFREK